jgi:hypothetical protein
VIAGATLLSFVPAGEERGGRRTGAQVQTS